MSSRTFASTGWQRPVPPLTPGDWRGTPGPFLGVTTLAVNTERAQLVWLPPGIGLQSIGAIASGTVAADLRFGIRQDNGGIPGSLLLDAGTAPAVTGPVVLPLNFTVPAGPSTGVPLWLCLAAQGLGVPVYTFQSTGEYRDFPLLSSALTYRGSCAQTGVSGALPNDFTPSSYSSSGPSMAVRAA